MAGRVRRALFVENEPDPELPVVITTAYESTRPILDRLGVAYDAPAAKPYLLPELEARSHAAG